MTDLALQPKLALRRLPDYQAGRSESTVRAELGLEQVIALAANEAADGALPSVEAALAEHGATAHRYPEVRSATLIEAIARFHDVPTDRIVVGPGSSGLLWQFSEAFLRPDSTVVAPRPSFDGYPLLAAIAGAHYVTVPLTDHRIDVERMVAEAHLRADVLFIPEPNNPTGTAIGGRGLRRLIDETRGRCFLILDEAYVEFNDHPDMVDAVDLARGESHVLVLRTFSKAHGLAGLRVGYAVGAPEICRFLNRVAPPFSVNRLAQLAATVSLEATKELAHRVTSVTAERTRIEARLRAAGFAPPMSFANFVFLPMSDAPTVAAELERNGVVTRPVPKAGLRVTVGTRAENDSFLSTFIATIPPPRLHRSSGIERRPTT